MVTRIRRRMYEPMWFTAASRGLRYAPEERQRPLHDPRHVLAPGGVAQEKARRRINDVFHRSFIEAADRGLLLVEALGAEPRRDFLLDLLAGRPAPPGLVARPANGGIANRAEAIRPGVPGMEHLP